MKENKDIEPGFYWVEYEDDGPMVVLITNIDGHVGVTVPGYEDQQFPIEKFKVICKVGDEPLYISAMMEGLTEAMEHLNEASMKVAESMNLLAKELKKIPKEEDEDWEKEENGEGS